MEMIPMNVESKERAWTRILLWNDWICWEIAIVTNVDRMILKRGKCISKIPKKAERVSDDYTEQIGPLPAFYTCSPLS